MEKFESINDSLFKEIEPNEMKNIFGGDSLWHTWLTGRTKYTSNSTGLTYNDKMEYDEECDCKIEVIDWNSGS